LVLGGKNISETLKPKNIFWLNKFQVHAYVYNIPTR